MNTCDHCGQPITGLAFQRETKHWVKPGEFPTYQFCNEQCASMFKSHVTQEEKDQIVKEYLTDLARRGGRVKSARKAAACRLNGSRPKKKREIITLPIDKPTGLGVD